MFFSQLGLIFLILLSSCHTMIPKLHHFKTAGQRMFICNIFFSSYQEMLAIMKSIYDMMGRYTYPCVRDDAPSEHVDKFFQVYHFSDCKFPHLLLLYSIIYSVCTFFFFFQKMDRNRDGVVTIEEFIETCQKVIVHYSNTKFTVSCVCLFA